MLKTRRLNQQVQTPIDLHSNDQIIKIITIILNNQIKLINEIIQIIQIRSNNIRDTSIGNRTLRIQFLGLTATDLDEFDGYMLAAALAEAPPRVDGQISSMSETLDLTRIAFDPEIRARLLKAGEKAGVRVVLSRADGPALRR